MGKRTDTTLGFTVEDADLRELAALLAQITSYVSGLGGAGGFAVPQAAGTAHPAVGAAPNSIPASPTASTANLAPMGGISPVATGGQSAGVTPVPNAAPTLGGGAGNLSFAGASTITILNATLVNIAGAQVTVVGYQGGGAEQAPGVPLGHVPSGGGGGGSPSSGGGGGGGGGNPFANVFEGGGGMGALGGLVSGIAGSAAVGFGVHTLAALNRASYNGDRWQTTTENIVGGIPLLGGLLNSIISPALDRSAQADAISELAGRAGISNDPFWTQNPSAVLQDPFSPGRQTGYAPRLNNTVNYAAQMLRMGVAPNMSALNAMDAAPAALREPMADAMLRAQQMTGDYGRAGGLSQLDAEDLLWADEDFQGALDTNSGPAPRALLRDRRRKALRTQRHNIYAQGLRGVDLTAGYAEERGDYAGAARAIRFGQGARVMELMDAQQGERDAQRRFDTLNQGDSIGTDAWNVALAKLREYQNAVLEVVNSIQTAEIRAHRAEMEGLRRPIEAAQTQTGIGLSTITGKGGIYGPEMQGLFNQQRGQAGQQVDVARQDYEWNLRTFGPNSPNTMDAKNRWLQAQQDQELLPFRQTEEKFGSLGGAASAAGQIARSAVSVANLREGMGDQSLPGMLAGLSAQQALVTLAQQRLIEDQRSGAGLGLLARDQAAIGSAQVGVEQARLDMATYGTPAPYDIAMRHAQNKLRRMESSWTEPGNMIDQYNTLERGAQGRVRAIDQHVARLRQAGVEITPEMQNRIDAQREDAQMEAFNYRVHREEGWMDRLVSESIGAPSFYARARPTNAEAAYALEHGQSEEGYRQSRQLGFVSARGYNYEKKRGFTTAGLGPTGLFPGDLGLQALVGGKQRAVTPAGEAGDGGLSDRDIDSLLGIGGGDAGGGATEASAKEANALLKQILAALQQDGGGGRTRGATALGDQGISEVVQRAVLSPLPGDTRSGRRP